MAINLNSAYDTVDYINAMVHVVIIWLPPIKMYLKGYQFIKIKPRRPDDVTIIQYYIIILNKK